MKLTGEEAKSFSEEDLTKKSCKEWLRMHEELLNCEK